MPFDALGQYVPPHSWSSDKLRGIPVDAARNDAQDGDMAAALTALRQRLDLIVLNNFNPTLYYTRSQIDGLLLNKQDRLTFTPVNAAQIGAANGVAPLDATGKVPDTYLPAAQTAVAGVRSFNSRLPDGSGNVSLSSSDIVSALGYTPDSGSSARSIGQITGLQAALDAKQPLIQNTAAFSTTEIAGETDLAIGTVLMVNMTGVSGLKKRERKTVYLGTTDTDPYNLAGSGSPMIGVWACVGFVSGTVAAFQRVS